MNLSQSIYHHQGELWRFNTVSASDRPSEGLDRNDRGYTVRHRWIRRLFLLSRSTGRPGGRRCRRAPGSVPGPGVLAHRVGKGRDSPRRTGDNRCRNMRKLARPGIHLPRPGQECQGGRTVTSRRYARRAADCCGPRRGRHFPQPRPGMSQSSVSYRALRPCHRGEFSRSRCVTSTARTVTCQRVDHRLPIHRRTSRSRFESRAEQLPHMRRASTRSKR